MHGFEFRLKSMHRINFSYSIITRKYKDDKKAIMEGDSQAPS